MWRRLGLNTRQVEAGNGALKVLTWATATISLISLTQRLFEVGLGTLSAQYLGYYRKIAYAIFGWVPELVGVHLPATIVDFWTLSFICAGAYVRTENLEQARAFRRYNFSSPCTKLRIAIFFVWGFTGFGLAVPLSVTSIHTYTENDIMREALKNFTVVVGATIVFFAINAFAPSA